MYPIFRRLFRVSLVLMAMSIASCGQDGQVRTINGRYVKVYPDKDYGSGWYWVDKDGNKHHLEQLPKDDDPFDPANDPLNRYAPR